MNQVVLPLIQPTNNSQIQKNISSVPEGKESNFSDIFANAVQEQSKEVSQKDGAANNSINEQNTNGISEKGNEAMDAAKQLIGIDKTSNTKDSGFELKETVSARKFLEKLGLDEVDIQNILQIHGLSENATLLKLLNNLNVVLELDKPDNLPETSVIDFLSKLDIEDEKIEEITQRITGQIVNLNEKGADGKFQPVISVKNLFEDIGLFEEKYTDAEVEDLSANNFFQKLGLNEKETQNLVKELGNGKSFNGKTLLNIQESNAKDLLKQMGLNSDEIAKVLEKSFENTGDKNKLKDLILNKDFSALKKWVSSEKFHINSSGKSDFKNIFQALNKNDSSDSLMSKVQSETVLSANSISYKSLVSSVQTSGSANGPNTGGETNGYTLPTNISNETKPDSRIYESAPKSFFERTVIDQIVSKVSFKGTGGQQEIKVHLEPPSLGSLQLKVSVEGKSVNTSIITDNNITKEIIQANLQQLKNSMADQGLKLGNVSVLVGEGGSGNRNMDEFRMFTARKNMEHPAGMKENISSNPLERNSGSFYRTGYMFSQSGVDLFI